MSTDTIEILVSPDRKNLMFHVEQVKKSEEMEKLQWIVDLVKEKGTEMPKTIIFLQYLQMRLLQCLSTYCECWVIMYLYWASLRHLRTEW